MANADVTAQAGTSSRFITPKSLMLGVGLAIILGGGAFYATWSGLLLADGVQATNHPTATVPATPDIAFIPIPPFVVSIGPGANARHLRFQAQLEVSKANEESVTFPLPRIVDVLNGYLRAIKPEDFEEPASLDRMRSQMLRRSQIVAGEEGIHDLLIMEFVLN